MNKLDGKSLDIKEQNITKIPSKKVWVNLL